MKHWWNDTEWGKTERLGDKSVSVPFSTPQIPHGLLWEQTWASVVRSWQLTARFVA
jgi:hypothetical protein